MSPAIERVATGSWQRGSDMEKVFCSSQHRRLACTSPSTDNRDHARLLRDRRVYGIHAALCIFASVGKWMHTNMDSGLH
ncbi:MAG: hypothetical protein DWQ08_14660 [Proteobacteria bacterium]|nr:MAG: hypothetical protein DWQ08_14660 [Pseudomonadota bacterium]